MVRQFVRVSGYISLQSPRDIWETWSLGRRMSTWDARCCTELDWLALLLGREGKSTLIAKYAGGIVFGGFLSCASYIRLDFLLKN